MEAESPCSFIPLQLDTFHALQITYDPSSEWTRSAERNEGTRRRPALRIKEALRKCAIGTKVIKMVGDGRRRSALPGQVYDFARRINAPASRTTIRNS